MLFLVCHYHKCILLRSMKSAKRVTPRIKGTRWRDGGFHFFFRSAEQIDQSAKGTYQLFPFDIGLVLHSWIMTDLFC